MERHALIIMEITKLAGKHNEDDRLILIETKGKEALKLYEIFDIVYEFAKNEINRINYKAVRKDMITGKRPFLFEKEIITAINKAKKELLKDL